jgi:hypothetical protein
MRHLEQEIHLGDTESAEDAVPSTESLEQRLITLERELAELPPGAPLETRLKRLLDSSYLLLDLDRRDRAWQRGQEVLAQALDHHLWTQAVEACDILYQADRPESIRALAHGIWLGVTFPIDPELSVAMLQHLVDETPDRSDGAAVAAATAAYVVDLRAKGKQREELQFFTGQLLGQVARRHSQVEEQEIFDFWMDRLELKEPAKFLPRLAKVLEVITADQWWFDREALRSLIPENEV